MQLPARLGPPLNHMRRLVRVVALSIRRRLDRTGLFPELTADGAAELRKLVREGGELSKSYLLMCGLSAGIASLGLLQSSSAVVIGAMLISPLMGPIASMGFGFASLDGRQIRESVRVVVLGAAIGVLTAMVLTWISPIRNATPEIIARTEPTLLDMAIATLSGMAGAFATVWQRGATAIGVAIATALMPPLATVGYALAIANPAFLGGALLLFLTNLAAIAFSFALVARLSGATPSFAKVEVKAPHVAAGVAIFAALATPLALQLYRITREANAVLVTRRVLQDELHIRRSNIAQLEVRWPLRGTPEIETVVIAPEYHTDAEAEVGKRLNAELGTTVRFDLQQVVASNVISQTRALVDSAIERTVAGISKDVPPLTDIRASLGIPAQAVWTNRAERSVAVVPVAAQGWTLGDYRRLEASVQSAGQGWKVNIVPPAPQALVVPVTVVGDARRSDQRLDDAIWAIGRWSLAHVTLAGFSGKNDSAAEQDSARADAQFVGEVLAQVGIGSSRAIVEARSPRLRELETEAGGEDGVEITILPAPVRSAAAGEPAASQALP